MPGRVADQQMNQVAALVGKPLAASPRVLGVNRDVMRAYNERMQRELETTVWIASRISRYRNAAVKVVANWPLSTLAYWWHMRAPDLPDLEARE